MPTTRYVNLGQAYSSFEGAKRATDSPWPILKVVRNGNNLTDVEIVPDETVQFVNFYPKGTGINPDPSIGVLYGAVVDAFNDRSGDHVPEVVTLKITRRAGKLVSIELTPDA